MIPQVDQNPVRNEHGIEGTVGLTMVFEHRERNLVPFGDQPKVF